MRDNERECVKCGFCPTPGSNITLRRFPMPGKTNSSKCESWAKFCFPRGAWSSPQFQKSLFTRHVMLCTRHFKASSFTDESLKKLAKSATPDEECDRLNLPEPSELSSSLTPFSEETPSVVCICCLEKELPFVNLWTCSHAEYLANFAMPEMGLRDQVICYQCHNMLKKIKLFKMQVEESFKQLSNNTENITKNSQKILNLQKCQKDNIDIPSTWKERKRYKKRGNPQTIPKKAKTGTDNIEDIPKTSSTEHPQTISEQAKVNVENSLLPNSDRKTKNIEDALKIIKINQNSGCINLLATSLQTISYSLLGSICNTNVGIGNQINTNPSDILFINTPSTSNATHNSGEHIITEIDNTNLGVVNQISAPTDITYSILQNTTATNNAASVSSTTTENNNTNSGIGNQISAPKGLIFSILNNTPATSNATFVSTENNNTNLGIGNQTSTTSVSSYITTENNNTNLGIENQISAPTDTLFSINTPTTSDATHNCSATTEKNNTNLGIGKQNIALTDMLFSSINTPRIANATHDSSKNTIVNNTTENDEIQTDETVKSDFSIIEITGDEELVPLENVEDMDGGLSNMQTNEPVMTKPSLGSNIRQLTLTRKQLLEERTQIASSPAFLRAPHRCESCLVGFQFKENLDDHVLRKHTEERMRFPLQCDLCLQYVESGGYENHLFWHRTRFECVACSQKFASYDKAAVHYKKHHRVNKMKVLLKCPRCPYKTGNMYDLKRHLRRIMTCKSCGDVITLGCGTSMTYSRHVGRCKGPRTGSSQATAGPSTT